MVLGSNPSGGRGPTQPPVQWVSRLSRGKEWQGRDNDPSPPSAVVKKEKSYTSIPLLPLWAVRPVQSLSACTRVHFAFLPLLTKTFITTQDDHVIGNANGEDNCADVYKIHCQKIQKIGSSYFWVKFNVIYYD